MKEKNSGLRISLRQVSHGLSMYHVMSGMPVGICLLLGISDVIYDWFPSIGAEWWMIFLGMAVIYTLLCVMELTGYGRWICFILISVILIGCFALQSQVLNGIRYLSNDIMSQMTKVTGRIYLDYTVTGSGSALWGAIPIMLLLVIFIHLAIQTGRILFSLVIFLPVYGAVFIGLFPVDRGILLLGIGFVFLMAESSAGKTGTEGFLGIPSWLILAAFCLIVSAGAGTWLGKSYTQDKQDELTMAVHDYLYNEETNSMPEGRLKNLPAWNKSDTPALEVKMTVPQKMYFRGQVYELYTGTAWEAVKNENLAEYESLFYWLHQNGFYGQSQIALASSYTGQIGRESMKIKNLSACRKHGYIPYAMASTDLFQGDRIGDVYFDETENLYYLSGSVPEWYAVQQTLAFAQERSNLGEYLAAEEAYENYVQSVDLQMTKESWAFIDQLAGEADSVMTLSQIRNYVRKYLEEAMIYDEKINTLNGSGDFLSYTLGKSASGYNVHYATVATMMLRYFGVPARYVEGYFLSAEEASAYQPGQTIILTEEHAHAWTEYYLPGVGFIPFEVTPGYMDDEENELGALLEQNTEMYQGNKLKYAQVEEPEQVTEKEQSRFSFAMKPLYVMIIGFLLLCIVGFMILLKRRKFNGIMQQMNQSSNREYITGRYGYARKLLESCMDISVEGSEEAEILNREAMFSNHEMTDEQRQHMNQYSGCVLNACKEKWTIMEKIRYRLWDCLY